jgi:hypothetical protein
MLVAIASCGDDEDAIVEPATPTAEEVPTSTPSDVAIDGPDYRVASGGSWIGTGLVNETPGYEEVGWFPTESVEDSSERGRVRLLKGLDDIVVVAGQRPGSTGPLVTVSDALVLTTDNPAISLSIQCTVESGTGNVVLKRGDEVLHLWNYDSAIERLVEIDAASYAQSDCVSTASF